MIGERRWVTWLAVLLVLIWTLVPLYWFLAMAFKTPAEISVFPPSSYPHKPNPAGLFNVLGFEYVSSTGKSLSRPVSQGR